MPTAHLPTDVNRQTHSHDRKKYIPATSLVGGKNICDRLVDWKIDWIVEMLKTNCPVNGPKWTPSKLSTTLEPGAPPKVMNMKPISSQTRTANDTCCRYTFKALYSTAQEKPWATESNTLVQAIELTACSSSLVFDKLYIVLAIYLYQLYTD